jgi:hypothetical protein
MQLVLAAVLIDLTLEPGPVRPSDSIAIVSMTGAMLLLWLLSLVAVRLLRQRAATGDFLFSLDVVSSVGVACMLIPLLWSVPTASVDADHPAFRLLPCGALKCLPLACRLDGLLGFATSSNPEGERRTTSSKQTLWIKYLTRSSSSLFIFSWLLGNMFVVLHDREDVCSPSVLWLHAVLLLLGGGASTENVGCLITEQSSVAKVSALDTFFSCSSFFFFLFLVSISYFVFFMLTYSIYMAIFFFLLIFLLFLF